MTGQLPAEDANITLIVDRRAGKVACVLQQTLYGCGQHNEFLQMTFDPEFWEVGHSEHYSRVSGTPAQWRAYAQRLKDKKKSA